MSVAISIDNVTKKYGDFTVIDGLSAEIYPGEFFTLLGPSGCGKTTLLRMIIGFNSIEGGEIRINNKKINDIHTNKRNMGMVFQNYAVFPHMSVFDNVAFGLKMRKESPEAINNRVSEILKTVQIDNLRDRMPDQLSGGQQQRVALARAIVISPEVLLMDEPLSNLDAKLRVEMRNAIKEIQHQTGITTVYVTHDQEEALAVSDRIAVMNNGVIQQIDTPQRLYQRPNNKFVATFIGLSNIIDANVKKENGKTILSIPQIDVSKPAYEVEMNTLRKDIGENQVVSAVIRPEEFILNTETDEGLEAIVDSSVFLGSMVHYFLHYGELELEVIVPSDGAIMLKPGSMVRLKVKPNKINIFSKDGEFSLIAQGVD